MGSEMCIRDSFLFLRLHYDDATMFLWGLPQKHNLSRLEPNWRQSRLKPGKISDPDPEVFTPPVETTVRQSRYESSYKAQTKKIEIISKIIGPTCSRNRSPQYDRLRRQESLPARVDLQTRIAPRNRDL